MNLKRHKKNIIISLPLIFLVCGCSPKTSGSGNGGQSSSVVTSVERNVRPAGGVPASVVLKATAFKMSGDYSDNVAIGVNEKGELTYYPAPGDITSASVPVSLGNGWWLNRQGLGKGYRFTRYTFSEYSRLKEVPTKEELLEAVIPGAVVTEIRTLTVPASEAMDRLEEIKSEL